MAGSNRRPPRYKHVALPTELMELLQTSLYFLKQNFLSLLYEVLNAEGGIRTHEAVAVELKSTPFDRSGTSADLNRSNCKYINICSMAGSNRRPPRYKHVALPTELMELLQTSLYFLKQNF